MSGGSPPEGVSAERGGKRPPASPPVGASPDSMLRPEHLYKAVGLLFLFLVFHSHFREVSRVLLIAYTAAILAVAFNVVVGLVPRHRRLLSVVLGLTIFMVVGAALWVAIPALARQLRGLMADLPRVEAEIRGLTDRIAQLTGVEIDLFGSGPREAIGSALEGGRLLGTAIGVVEGIILVLVVVVGGLYAVAKPNERLLTPVLHAIPDDRRESFRRLFLVLGERLKGWVKGTLMGMTAVGTLVTLGLWALGVRYSLLLGVIAGLLEIMPIAGPWISGAIAVSVALLDDPTRAIWVALLMLAIQQVENNFITPMVMARAAEVHPFVTLFALFFFGSLFGFLGLVLAVPLVLLVWTVFEVLWVGRAIGAEGDRIPPLVKE